MKKPQLKFFVSLIVTLVVIALLVSGSSLLTLSLNKSGTLPLGTFISWAGIICLPLSVYWGVSEFRKPTKKANRVLSLALKLVLILAFLWVPISFGLAGNMNFNFGESSSFQGGQLAMRIFWIFSYGIGIGSLAVLGIYFVLRLLKIS